MPRARELLGACVAALVVAAHGSASAQPRDLGTIEVPVPEPLRLDDFVIVSRQDVPVVSVTEVPLDAREALLQRRTAREAAHSAAMEYTRTHADVDQRRLDEAVLRERAVRTTLLDVLGRQEATLSRPALLLLGMLRHEVAAEAELDALDRFEACVASGAACTEPTLDDASAVGTWARVDGGDLLAAHSAYQRGMSAQQRGDVAEARALFTRTLAFSSLPPRMEAETAFALGELAEDDAAALAAYARCAALSTEEIAPHCALRAASLELRAQRPADALARLLPFTSATDVVVAREALRLAAEASIRVDDASPAPPEVMTARAERLAAITGPTPSPDTMAAWLARAGSYCADVLDLDLDLGRVAVRVRGRGAARPTVTAQRASEELTRCMSTRAPAPASALTGAFRAVLVLVPRARHHVPHVRSGEF